MCCVFSSVFSSVCFIVEMWWLLTHCFFLLVSTYVCYRNVLPCGACFIWQKKDEQMSSTQLVRMALGVAKGMEYLSHVGFVHRVSCSTVKLDSNVQILTLCCTINRMAPMNV